MKKLKSELKKLCIILRFGGLDKHQMKYRCLPYAKIASLLGCSISTVRKYVLEHVKNIKHLYKGPMVRTR